MLRHLWSSVVTQLAKHKLVSDGKDLDSAFVCRKMLIFRFIVGSSGEIEPDSFSEIVSTSGARNQFPVGL